MKVDLPDWVDPEAWAGWVEMRKKIKAPLTKRAVTLNLNKLEKLRDDGENPTAVLDQSTERAWRGLFPVHDSNGSGAAPRGRPSAAAHRRANLDKLLGPGKPEEDDVPY